MQQTASNAIERPIPRVCGRRHALVERPSRAAADGAPRCGRQDAGFGRAQDDPLPVRWQREAHVGTCERAKLPAGKACAAPLRRALRRSPRLTSTPRRALSPLGCSARHFRMSHCAPLRLLLLALRRRGCESRHHGEQRVCYACTCSLKILACGAAGIVAARGTDTTRSGACRVGMESHGVPHLDSLLPWHRAKTSHPFGSSPAPRPPRPFLFLTTRVACARSRSCLRMLWRRQNQIFKRTLTLNPKQHQSLNPRL